MNWTTTRRETGLVEHVCSHSVGHPNMGSALWLAEQWAKRDAMAEGPSNFDQLVEEHEHTEMVHGCDGCCGRDDFPGTYRDSLIHAHRIISDRNDDIQVHVDCVHRLAEQLTDLQMSWLERLLYRMGWGGRA